MIKIPRKASDILAINYIEYEKYLKSIKDEEYDEIVLMKKILEIFYNMTEEDMEQRPAQQLKDMAKIIMNIISDKHNVVLKFSMNNIEYGLNPNFDDMTLGELIDCDTEDVFRQIAVLYRPIKIKKGNKYIIEKYKADLSKVEMFRKNITLDVYLGFISFFLNICQGFISSTQRYIRTEGTNLKRKQVLANGGVGFRSYIGYVTGMLPNRIK